MILYENVLKNKVNRLSIYFFHYQEQQPLTSCSIPNCAWARIPTHAFLK